MTTSGTIITTAATNTNTGYLELILGPMFSGKTSKLIEVYKQCLFCSIPVTAINYAGDTRYSETMITTHDMQMMPCIRGNSIRDILNGENGEQNMKHLIASDVVLVNEGQFFPDIVEYVREWVEACGKRVYICGLDGDFERKTIGSLLDLVPMCDKIDKLTSLCSNCKNGTRAIFSYRITNEKAQIVIGTSNYIPVCRKCYTQLSAARAE